MTSADRPRRGRTLRFASFEVDPVARELFCEGRRLALQDKPLEILLALLERPWDLVTREELCQRLWPGKIVEFDNNLNTAVAKLRSALATAPGGDELVETIPRRGYRLRAEVERPPRRRRSPGRLVVRVVVAAGLAGGALALVVILGRPPAGEPPGAGENVGREPTAGAGEAAGSAAARDRGPIPGELAERRALVAVLPFVSLDPGEEAARRAAAVTEVLTTELARRLPPAVGVLARGSVLRSGVPPDVASVAGRLGADLVVEGSVSASGDGGLRVTVRLIQASDRAHLWAEVFSGDLSALPAVDAALAAEIGGLLAVGPVPARAAGGGEPVPPEAWQAYLEGRHLLAEGARGDHAAAMEAAARLRRAVELSPGLARAWATLADALARVRLPAVERIPEARRAAERALELDPRLAEAHHRLAAIALYHDRDWDEAGRRYRAALALGPNLARFHHSHAGYLATLGRHEEALGAIGRALELDPLSVVLHADAGWYLYVARRFEEAVERCREALTIDAGHRGALGYLLAALVELERWPEARDVAFALLAADGAPRRVIAEARTTAAEGAVAAYRRWRWDERREAAAGRWIAPDELALAALAAGDGAAAMEWLERAADERSGWLPAFAAVYPGLDPLRGDPRFQRWLASLEIPTGPPRGGRPGSFRRSAAARALSR